MLPTRRELLKLAAETGFAAPNLEKVTRLGEVLEVVSAHPRLAPALVLKGGTALNLFFPGSPARLSVDLDFNYIGQVERQRMLEERSLVMDDLERIGRSQGYAIQLSREAHAGRTLFLSYPGCITRALLQRRIFPRLRRCARSGSSTYCKYACVALDVTKCPRAARASARRTGQPRDAWHQFGSRRSVPAPVAGGFLIRLDEGVASQPGAAGGPGRGWRRCSGGEGRPGCFRH